jgi:hypothetical protein
MKRKRMKEIVLKSLIAIVLAMLFVALLAQRLFHPRWPISRAINLKWQKQSSNGCCSDISMVSSLHYRNPSKQNNSRRQHARNIRSESGKRLGSVCFDSNPRRRGGEASQSACDIHRAHKESRPAVHDTIVHATNYSVPVRKAREILRRFGFRVKPIGALPGG